VNPVGFANPNALWWLLLLIPLILAWKRRPRVTRAVGNAFLWRQTTARSATSFVAHVRRNWLFVAQVAFVLATVAALARPALPLGSRTVAVILDLSASMGAREAAATRLAAAKAHAISTIESFPRGTRVRLIAARGVPEQIGEYLAWDPALRGALRAQEGTHGAADVSAAIDVARGAGVAPAEIYVFSDGAPDASVRWIGIGTRAANAAITNIAVRRLPLSPAHGQVLVEAWNYWTEPLNADIEVRRNGSPIGRYPVRLPARDGTTVVVDVQGVDGVISARLMTDDVLEADNLRLAVLPPMTPVRVLLTGGTFFIEQALAANATLLVDRVRRDVRYDVVVCESCSEPPPGAGAVLLIPAASPNRRDPGAVALSAPDHPLGRMLDLGGIVATPVRPRSSDAGPGDDATVVARVFGDPVIIAEETNGRRIVELRLDVTDTSLGVSTAFPTLIANAIGWLAGREENSRELVAGEPLRWRFRGALPPRAEVIGPAGNQVPSLLAGSRLASSSTHAAGVYVVRGGAAEETFVVNPAIDGESDLGAAGRVAQGAAAPDTASRVEQPIATPLMLLALGLLSAEWWLQCRAARRA
jgi:hypothetical protein